MICICDIALFISFVQYSIASSVKLDVASCISFETLSVTFDVFVAACFCEPLAILRRGMHIIPASIRVIPDK